MTNEQLETPTDLPQTTSASTSPKRRYSQRGPRKRILGKGEGDYCIYQIIGEGQEMPRGSLVPIPEIPRFENAQLAMQWIKRQSKDLLAGKQVMIFKAHQILNIMLRAEPTVVIESKQRIAVGDPAHEDAP